MPHESSAEWGEYPIVLVAHPRLACSIRTLFMTCLSPLRPLRRKIICSLTKVFAPYIAGVLTGCHSLKPLDFAATRPQFDILQFYTGHTRSTGLLQTTGGEPLKRVMTETWGHLAVGELHMTQDVTFDDGKTEPRTWRIRRVDEHHYEARSEKVIGVAHGEAWGNALRLDYVLAFNKSNPLTRIRMTHWMTLQPDGRTMLNVVTVRKLGIVVGRITEVFRHESDTASAPHSR